MHIYDRDMRAVYRCRRKLTGEEDAYDNVKGGRGKMNFHGRGELKEDAVKIDGPRGGDVRKAISSERRIVVRRYSSCCARVYIMRF